MDSIDKICEDWRKAGVAAQNTTAVHCSRCKSPMHIAFAREDGDTKHYKLTCIVCKNIKNLIEGK